MQSSCHTRESHLNTGVNNISKGFLGTEPKAASLGDLLVVCSRLVWYCYGCLLDCVSPSPLAMYPPPITIFVFFFCPTPLLEYWLLELQMFHYLGDVLQVLNGYMDVQGCDSMANLELLDVAIVPSLGNTSEFDGLGAGFPSDWNNLGYEVLDFQCPTAHSSFLFCWLNISALWLCSFFPDRVGILVGLVCPVDCLRPNFLATVPPSHPCCSSKLSWASEAPSNTDLARCCWPTKLPSLSSS